MNKTSPRIIKAKESEELDVWSYPNVQAEVVENQESHTNALGKKSTWRFEPPEEEIEEPEPLTAEEIAQGYVLACSSTVEEDVAVALS